MELSNASGFVPIDSELFIGETRAQVLFQPFGDECRVIAIRYLVALNQNKPQMAEERIRRTQRTGINAEYRLV